MMTHLKFIPLLANIDPNAIKPLHI